MPSLTRKHESPEVFYGVEALRQYRGEEEKDDPLDVRSAPGPPTPTPATTVPPPLSPVGFAIRIPLRSPEQRVAYVPSLKEACSLIREQMPPTFVQSESGRVTFWYALAESVQNDASDAVRETIWRTWNSVRLTAAAHGGWHVPSPRDEDMTVVALPADLGTFEPVGSERHYSISEVAILLDGFGIPKPGEQERWAADWQAKFDPPDLVVDPDATLPDEVMAPLLEDGTFLATWLRLREDVPRKTEAYDRELARLLSDRGHDNQTIVNAIIQHRRLHGRKAEVREDYLARILSQEFRGTARKITGEPERTTERATTRRQISVAADERDQIIVAELAKRAGHTVSNYIRTVLGLPPIYPGRRNPIEREDHIEAQYNRFLELEIDPTGHFPNT